MKEKLFVGWMCTSFGLMIGYYLGRSEASEDFYKKCQGGEVFLADPSGKPLQAVGCAEIARRIK